MPQVEMCYTGTNELRRALKGPTHGAKEGFLEDVTFTILFKGIWAFL